MNTEQKIGIFNAGEYKEYTQLIGGTQTKYRAFLPSLINKQYDFGDSRIAVLLERATQHLAGLDAYSRLVPDIDFFIRMHVRNEALKSSRIEGTKTSIDEVVLSEADVSPEKRDDWKEVQNYVKAMNYAVERLRDMPVCMRMLCETHKILLSGVRGQEKNLGKERQSQNWIGLADSDIRSATFVPPHPSEVSVAIQDLERFWHNENLNIPGLIKIAMSHYQFETIHPFDDGNGRIGRILIVLHFIEMGMLQKPSLYLSDYFEKYKLDYYETLTFVRERNDLDQWIVFFLNGVIKTAKKGKDVFESIIDLRERYHKEILGIGRRAELANKVLQYGFSNPSFDISAISEYLQCSQSAANNLVKDMEKIGVLKEITGYSRNRIFVLQEYIDLFK